MHGYGVHMVFRGGPNNFVRNHQDHSKPLKTAQTDTKDEWHYEWPLVSVTWMSISFGMERVQNRFSVQRVHENVGGEKKSTKLQVTGLRCLDIFFKGEPHNRSIHLYLTQWAWGDCQELKNTCLNIIL